MIAALFVDPRGHYPSIPDVDCWDEKRDARLYSGSHPVVLHPPCAAWCQLAGVREAKYGYPRGEDGGLFQFAVDQLMRCGGVLEHPAYSKAWAKHGLRAPVRGRGWIQVGPREWVCMLSQCAYGTRMRKLTWIAYVGSRPPFDLDWSEPYVPGTCVISGAKNHSTRPVPRVWTTEAKRTPLLFAQTLVALARHSRLP